LDQTDAVIQSVPVQLLKNDTLQQQDFTGGAGLYSVQDTTYGTYLLTVDTSAIPFYVSCPASGYDTVVLNPVNPYAYNRNLALNCKPGFDVGAWSIVPTYEFLPARFTAVISSAGDIANFYGGSCAGGVSGSVQLIIQGPVQYAYPYPGSLTPTSVSGDTVTWTIADYGTANFFTDFNVVVQTDTLAQAGNTACFTLVANPIANDNNPNNNVLTQCYTILSAHDPNHKDVYPTGPAVSGEELTYTIHFQNTGNAPAQNITVTDTLDSNLDASTFKLLAYSKLPQIRKSGGNILQFYFPGINLPDSVSSADSSIGYIQFSVKAKANLATNALISNTAFIIFDFNAPVATNTVSSSKVTDIKPAGCVSGAAYTMELIPNPTRDDVVVVTGGQLTGGILELRDQTGRLIMKQTMDAPTLKFATNQLAAGVYIVKIFGPMGHTAMGRLVKQ
jgi:uncharacterized repeat protein (TIGR01451 family)